MRSCRSDRDAGADRRCGTAVAAGEVGTYEDLEEGADSASERLSPSIGLANRPRTSPGSTSKVVRQSGFAPASVAYRATALLPELQAEKWRRVIESHDCRLPGTTVFKTA